MRKDRERELLQAAEEKARMQAEKLAVQNQELIHVKEELALLTSDLEGRVSEDTVEIRKLNEELKERAQKVESLLIQKDQFIYQLAHDLRTPLTPILGLLPRLSELEGQEHGDMVQIIERNARHIQNIASKSLKLARLNSLDYIPDCEAIDLGEIIRTVLEINRMSLRQAHIETVVEVPEGCVIHGDQILIQELVDNLVSNAIKFSNPSGGCIRIQVKNDDDSVTLVLRDTGIGLMAGEEISIFEEFYKSDRSRHDKSSTGLGLAICRKIVQKHHGTIKASSDGPDQGTTFTIVLPIWCNYKAGNQ